MCTYKQTILHFLCDHFAIKGGAIKVFPRKNDAQCDVGSDSHQATHVYNNVHVDEVCDAKCSNWDLSSGSRKRSLDVPEERIVECPERFRSD